MVFTVWINWRAKALEILSNRHDGRSALLGKAAPDFSLPSLEGRTVSLADFRGRNVVVTYWASWCGPCRLELPMLRTLYQCNHKDGVDFEILAISLDDTREAAAMGATELKMPFPVLLDPGSKIAERYKVDAIPALFVIDKQGIVKVARTGFQMGTDIEIAQGLGIRDYSPMAQAGGKN